MHQNFEQYRGFIFDMDGTLLDTMPAHLKAWQITAKEFGFPFDLNWLHGLGGMPSKKIVAEINRVHGLDLTPETVSQFKMKTFAENSNDISVINVTEQILQKYYNCKAIAIGTGSQRESAQRLLTQTGVIDKIDVIVAANDVVGHKPEPDTFLLAAERLNLEPVQCVVFEDTLLGLQAAHAAGMDCYLVVGDSLEFHKKSPNQ
ncbi:beta-phosphoglucomutase family hydrolase [Vibrio intestinalis]|uniref:beta-phosphoglucomutase family hydrolase n=1 Tax=Vibrio intestinalis TaxID=2933291 RepID=UPI0021A81F88|nr:beta-phosphoglucomutase family hydrolase [Vibrio intestinalis]